MLEGLRARYEQHHVVRIADEAVVAAVELSARYVTERFLPDKAIDLLDRAGARVRLRQ
jgi:ATP-dependent Clp protease ATP-binding subunit ClpC